MAILKRIQEVKDLKSKKLIVLLVAVLMMFAVAGCGGGGQEAQQSGEPAAPETMEPVTIKFADFFPNTHPASVNMMQHWATRVEEVTDGLVKVDLYPAGTLLKNGDIFDGVVSGVADMGHDVSGYNLGRLPVLNAMYVGGIKLQSGKVSCNVARDLLNELQPKELEGTQLMFVYGITPGVLMTTKPVRTMEDLKGMQIRASGANVDTLKALGATPVGITIAETYDSMSKGVVDGALLPAEALAGFKLAEVTKYVTQCDFMYNTVHYCVMNKAVWDSFPKDIQDKINEVNEEVFNVASDLWDKTLTKGGTNLAIEKGSEIIQLTPEEEARWIEALAPLKDDYAKVLDEKGYDGKAVMKRIVELAEKYNAEYGDNVEY